jgi:hypothetical protein
LQLRTTVATTLNQWQTTSGAAYVDVQFFEQAVDVLFKCRHTLMFTYPFAYYLYPNNQVAIFELNQEMLAKAVEELSGRLEDEKLSTRDITEQRRTISDLM